MKAVIVEIRSDRAAALTEEGQFVSIANSGYEVGQEITLLRRKKKNSFRRNIAAVAAAAVLVFSAGGGGLAYAMPYGTVSVDVNPSIEYTINCFDRVLRVTGVNEDGENILEQIDSSELLNKKIEHAVSVTIEQLREDGYLEEEDSCVIISSGTNSENHSLALAKTLEESVMQTAEVYSVAVSREDIGAAHEMGTTAGKMKIVRDLEGSRTEADPEEEFNEREWLDKPVDDIMQEIRQGEPRNETEDEFVMDGQTEKTAGGEIGSTELPPDGFMNKDEMALPDNPGTISEARPESPSSDMAPGDFRDAAQPFDGEQKEPFAEQQGNNPVPG